MPPTQNELLHSMLSLYQRYPEDLSGSGQQMSPEDWASYNAEMQEQGLPQYAYTPGPGMTFNTEDGSVTLSPEEQKELMDSEIESGGQGKYNVEFHHTDQQDEQPRGPSSWFRQWLGKGSRRPSAVSPGEFVGSPGQRHGWHANIAPWMNPAGSTPTGSLVNYGAYTAPVTLRSVVSQLNPKVLQGPQAPPPQTPQAQAYRPQRR